MRAVDLAPLLEHRQDLRGLAGEQAVHRPATGPLVGQGAALGALGPAVRPDPTELEDLGGAGRGPALGDGLAQQTEQGLLGGRVDSAWDSATQPQGPFPSISINLTASSFTVSDNRAISAFAASNSPSRAGARIPGRDSASAASAPSLATCRIRSTVERSTWCTAAASAIVTSCRTSCSQISYFCDGLRNRFARRPARSVPRPSASMIRSSSRSQRPHEMLSDTKIDLYR